MRPIRTLPCLFAALLIALTFSARAEDQATPQEVVQKVKQAAEFLSKSGDAGLAQFSRKESEYVWKDTYVWVLDCDKMTDAAHPTSPKLVGKNLAGMKDSKGNYFFIQLCEKAKVSGSGWIEYWWPKVNEKQPSRKVSYIMQVPKQPYQAAAGIYDDKASLEELERTLK